MANEAEALRARLEAAVTEIHGHITTPEGMAAWNRLNAADVAIRSALAEDTARAAEGWEPIETAPRDGTEVDLWAVKDHGRSAGRRTNCHWGRPVFGAEYFGDPGWRGLHNQYSSETPTHWRPLPAPPALPLTKEAADANR